jgi:Proteolysis_6 C-terminal
MFVDTLQESKRQEMSREKLLSKLLLSIQCFTYSVACEAYEARRNYRKSGSLAHELSSATESNCDSVLARYGIAGVACGGRLVVLPDPTPDDDDGAQPFDGRLGKLRYFALSVMAASGAVASDIVQIVIQLPTRKSQECDEMRPVRSPVAEPILFGHVLTHVVAAMCAACGRGRAHSDALEVSWPASIVSRRGSLSLTDDVSEVSTDSVTEDCEGFIKLGLLARVLQVLLAKLGVPPAGFKLPAASLSEIRRIACELETQGFPEVTWVNTCLKLIECALSNGMETGDGESSSPVILNAQLFREACSAASLAAVDYLVDAGVTLQLLIPGVMYKYELSTASTSSLATSDSAYGQGDSLEEVRQKFKIEPIHEMLESPLVREVVSGWYDSACEHDRRYRGDPQDSSRNLALRKRLFRSQGYHSLDWPCATNLQNRAPWSSGDGGKRALPKAEDQPQDDEGPHPPPPSPMQIDPPSFRSSPASQRLSASMSEVPHSPPASLSSSTVVTLLSKKTVPLLGGYAPDDSTQGTADSRPRVAVLPTSYTDLYAELGSLLPDCEQTAVCLVCGEVLNAGGKGECTRHSHRCGGGAGIFFLLQECSGLIMHKSKAAYIHSPYVDSHGETPQFRGRPLNLDLVRYEHLRELWMGHMIRQTVVAERGASRQVILPDFY